MLYDFADIRSLMDREPDWFDDHGVPRWGTFTPDKAPNIYGYEAVLAEIRCQGCGKLYRVCFSWNIAKTEHPEFPLAQHIRSGTLHYGDPPNACCHRGATMNSIPVRVLEYWLRPLVGGWNRDSSLEVSTARPDD